MDLNLRRERELRGLSQRQLATKTGKSQAAISMIESGQRSPSTALKKALIAELAKTPLVAKSVADAFDPLDYDDAFALPGEWDVPEAIGDLMPALKSIVDDATLSTLTRASAGAFARNLHATLELDAAEKSAQVPDSHARDFFGRPLESKGATKSGEARTRHERDALGRARKAHQS